MCVIVSFRSSLLKSLFIFEIHCGMYLIKYTKLDELMPSYYDNVPVTLIPFFCV